MQLLVLITSLVLINLSLLNILTKGDFYHSQETKSDGTRYVYKACTPLNTMTSAFFNG